MELPWRMEAVSRDPAFVARRLRILESQLAQLQQDIQGHLDHIGRLQDEIDHYYRSLTPRPINEVNPTNERANETRNIGRMRIYGGRERGPFEPGPYYPGQMASMMSAPRARLWRAYQDEDRIAAEINALLEMQVRSDPGTYSHPNPYQ